MAEDDLLEQLGMSDLGKPMTPEETFYYAVIGDKHAKHAMLLHFIMEKVGFYRFLLNENIKIGSNSVVKTSNGDAGFIGFVPITLVEFTKKIIKNYLLANHFPRFNEDFYIGSTLALKSDIDITVDLFINDDSVKAAMQGKFAL